MTETTELLLTITWNGDYYRSPKEREVVAANWIEAAFEDRDDCPKVKVESAETEARVRAQVAAEIAEAIEAEDRRLHPHDFPAPGLTTMAAQGAYRNAAKIARQHATDDHQETPQ